VSGDRLAGTALLCLVVFSSTICIGAFGPLLPEIARVQGLPDWELGVLAGSFGFARMAADLPAGAFATRRLAAALILAPITLLAGMLLLATAGPLPVLVMGRILTGLAHTLIMVGSLTAVLQDKPGPRASIRLNTLEFSGMLGVLGGLVLVGLLPERWRWNVTLLAATTPALVALPAALVLARYFPARLGA
jgi:predicted MFS family arabinose efflux permease